MRLNEWRFRQFKQRVALRCALAPLTLEQSAAYIAGRIRLAGGDPGRLFSREAVIAVHDRARGIPRTINVICENALLSAFASRQATVCAELAQEVSRDFDLDAAAPEPVAVNQYTGPTHQNEQPLRPSFGPPRARSLASAIRLADLRGDLR